jgi:hypothetical protein
VRGGKEIKERERVVGKAAGDECVFIPGDGPGWQMRSGPTPYRTRRAVRTFTNLSIVYSAEEYPHCLLR